MCAELTAVPRRRIVIPIVFRNAYQTALRNLSEEGRRDPYAGTLARAWPWSTAMRWHDRATVDGHLVAWTHALADSTTPSGPAPPGAAVTGTADHVRVAESSASLDATRR